jgi:hypothetical protein
VPARGHKSEDALDISWLQKFLLSSFALSLTLGSRCFDDFLYCRARNKRLSIESTVHLHDLTVTFAVSAPAPDFRPFRSLPLYPRLVHTAGDERRESSILLRFESIRETCG